MPLDRRSARIIAVLGATSSALLIGVVVLAALHLSGGSTRLRAPAFVGEDARRLFTPVPDPEVAMTFAPCLDGVPAWATRVPLSTNRTGLRDHREIEPPTPGVYRVVLLGDSFVAGHGARYDDTLARQLEALLARDSAAGGEIEVRPIGVSGWNLVSQIAWLERHLHVVRPNCVVHLINGNDFDNGYGFVLGGTLTTTHDTQRVFGREHFSIVAPAIFARAATEIRGLVGSGLIPESQRRYRLVAQRLARLRELLARQGAAHYVMLLQRYHIAFAVQRYLGVPDEQVLLCPRLGLERTLMPKDGHPNREGYAVMAAAIARFLHERGHWPLRAGAHAATEGSVATLADIEDPEEDALRAHEVDRIPAAVDFTTPSDGGDDARLRTVVGGVLPGGWLSTEAALVLRRRGRETAVELDLEFPAVPALCGGTVQVRVAGRDVATLAMDERPGEPRCVRAGIPEGTSDLVEVMLSADRWFTGPEQLFGEDHYRAMPRIGRVLAARLVD